MKAARAALGLALRLGCVLGAAAADATSPGEAIAAQQAGWVKSGSCWWYAQPGGGYARGWLKVDPSWYWFDSSRWMATGWQKVGSSWYWLGASGAMATSQWVGAYYVGADGKWIPGYGQSPVTPASDF